MASLLKEPLFEISGQGPSPDKNFYHFAVTKSDVIWRWWRISLRAVHRCSRPGELRESHQDFLDDIWLQSQLGTVFGGGTLRYAEALCRGHYSYLDHLPDSFLLRIINYLELEDVGQLSQTSRRFRELCASEEFWEQAVRRRCNTVSAEVSSLALEVGWRRIFFTSKLQLQKMIRRQRLRAEEQPEGRGSDPHSEEGESPDESSQMAGSHPGFIPQLNLGTHVGFDPVNDPEKEAGSDSGMP